MTNELQKAWDLFLENVKSSNKAQKLMKAIGNSGATYSDAQEYSSLLSDLLVQSVSEIYPTNSEDVLKALKDSYFCKSYFSHIDNYAYSMQKVMNQANNIGLNAVKPSLKTQLVNDDTVYTNNYDLDIKRYKDLVELSGNKRVDTIQQANAKFQDKAGYGVTVSRKYDGRGLSDGRTCKWCLERVGSNIPYKQAVSRGMFQRHEGCHCIIEYNNNGEKTYQSSKGSRYSWIDSMGQKQRFEIVANKKENTKIFQTHESEYGGIFIQTYSANAQKMATFLDKNVKTNKKYNDLGDVIVVKNTSLRKIAGYEQQTNRFYISEELTDPKEFSLLVDRKYFPSEDLIDIINHELGGHKAHWDAVKRYARDNDLELYDSKQKLEEKLRRYIKQQIVQDKTYIQKTVSVNAYESFIERDVLNDEHDELLRKNNLNELIADAEVLIEKKQLNDSILEELVKEVINYDGSSN